MKYEYNIGDNVIVEGVNGKVIDVYELNGKCYAKVQTRHGIIDRPCSELSRA